MVGSILVLMFSAVLDGPGQFHTVVVGSGLSCRFSSRDLA